MTSLRLKEQGRDAHAATQPMTAWTFVHVADIHVGSPRSFRFQPAWNENWETAKRQIQALGPDLLLVGGDLTRDGTLHRFELETVKAELDRLPFPVRVIPGNMDTGNKTAAAKGFYDEQDAVSLNIRPEQILNFEAIFGSSRWTFLHKGVRFSGFCDMLIGSGLEEEGALWTWLDDQRRLPRARYHVWMTHYPLFIDALDEPNYKIDSGSEDEYLCWYFGMDNPGRRRLLDVFQATGATHVLSGHVHCRRRHRAAGIEFQIGPSTAFGQFGGHWKTGDPTLGFMKYEVSAAGIDACFVPLAEVSTQAGYGPPGHVAPEWRDYPPAWRNGP